MNKISKILFFILFIFIFTKNDSKEIEQIDPGYKELLEWGLSNSLNISDKIRFIKDKDEKKYISKELINKDEIIMDIPPECMMNLNKSLHLLNSKKFRKAYEQYIKEGKKKKEYKSDFGLEQTFMAYILYTINLNKEKYEKNKNKFYEYYKGMFYTFEENLDSLPFYYSNEQINLLLNTTFILFFQNMNTFIKDESIIFEKKIFKKTIIFEDYLLYRIYTIQKSYEVDGKFNIVPYLNYFKKNFHNINCELIIENGHMIVQAKENINPGEELVLKPNIISIHNRFLFFGETFDEALDIFKFFSIPMAIPHFITDKEIDFDLNSLGENSQVDLERKDFYKNMINIYQDIAKMINEDDSEIGACNLIIKYLNKLIQNLELIKSEDIRNAFFKKKDVDNVKRIIYAEKKLLEKKINIVKNYIKNLKENIDKNNNNAKENASDL